MPKARASTDGVRVADFAFPEKNEILYKNCMFFWRSCALSIPKPTVAKFRLGNKLLDKGGFQLTHSQFLDTSLTKIQLLLEFVCVQEG